ncbi:tubulin domain-containing protein [Xylaria bambusicola]|uniref:tubulin domain-containing protein n=1 Tax=Xylaria bambusicola TaxID=326684 RepID=UPI0020073E63|nr:tubulin domain-containing protein [Xylaria bambusicola]KAI0526591.1 tubulin domain-containing protein [Xylaria bambusicola]
MREIITLQLGQQSNYIATHFWNAQESYFTYGADEESPVDHDVHFRPGLGANGTETFMPRTVVYDLKGGFGTLKRLNALYDISEDAEASSLWSGNAVVHKQQPIDASAYQESLDSGQAPPELTTSTVRYWSDFNRVFYHPKSIIQLNEYELNSTLMPFEKWHMGEELFANLDREDDLLDRDLRPFVEEADHMQGIQIMTGLDDAWGGFATKYVERIRDEYGKTPVWVFGAQEPTKGLSREKRLLKLVNKARALAELSSQASLVVPLALPEEPLPSNIHLDPSSPWHVSALFAATIESTTLYTRLRTVDRIYSSNFSHMTDLLNVFGRQTIANIEMSPIDLASSTRNGPTNSRGDPISSLYERVDDDESESGSQKGAAPLDVDLSAPQDLKLDPGARKPKKRYVFSQVRTYRGPETENPADEEGGIDTGRFGMRRRPKVHNYRSSLSFPILDSYPAIFRDSNRSTIKEHMAMRTSLTTDTSVMDKIRRLRTTVIRSIGVEDREVIGNELAEIADGYKEGWSSGSDDDDDD